MVELHVNYSAIDALNGRGIAHGPFHAVTTTCRVPTVDAPQANLIDNDCVFSTWSRCVNVTLCSCEYLDVLGIVANNISFSRAIRKNVKKGES